MGLGISVNITTLTATRVYLQEYKDREIFLQNTDSTYYVHCGTFSGVTASSGVPRFILPPKPTGVTTNGTYSIYCIADPAAGGATIEIVGIRERNSKD